MEKYIEELKKLVAQHVFVVNNQEKVNLLRAREETRQKLLELRASIVEELDRLC